MRKVPRTEQLGAHSRGVYLEVMAALTQGPAGQSEGTPPRQAAEGTLGLSRVTALIGSIIGVGVLNLPGSSGGGPISLFAVALMTICAEMPLVAAKGGRFPGRFGRLSDRGVPQFGIVSSRVLASVAMVPVLREVRRVDHLQHPGVHVRDHRRDPLRILGAGPDQVARAGQPRDPHAPLRTRCHRRSGGDRVLRALRRLVAQPGEDLLIESSHSSSKPRSSSAFPSTSLSAPTTEPLPVPLCRT